MKKQFLIFALLSIVYAAESQTPVDTLWTRTLGGTLVEDVGFPYTWSFTKSSMTTDNQDNVFFVTNTFSEDGDVGKNYGNIDVWVVKLNSDGDTLWTKVFGGSQEDLGYGIAADNKGGCIVVGVTGSDDGSFTQTGHYGELGENDGYIAIFDTDGNIVKIKQYGGAKILMNFDDGTFDYVGGEDGLYNIIPTSDGNFMCVGHSSSYANDLGPFDDTQYWAGWFLKIDPNGKKMSSKKISASQDSIWKYLHYIYDIVETDEGDFIGIGEIYSEAPQFWVFRTDGLDNANKVWSKIYTSNNYEVPTAITRKDKETYLATGWIKASTGDVSEVEHGGADTWLFELDAKTGNQGLQRVFGGTGGDMPKDIIPLKNGNILLAGSSNSVDDDAFGGFGSADFWLLELDKNLDTLRMHKIGGTGFDDLAGVAESSDGKSFFIVGSTESNDFFVHDNKGYSDMWVGKIMADPTLDIPEVIESKISITCCPNPSTGIFNISNAKGYNINITDISGKKVYEVSIETQNITLDITNLGKGTYFLNCTNKNIQSTKIIIN